MQVRPKPGGELILDCSNTNGRLVAGNPTTFLVLNVDSNVMEVPAGRYVHDIWVDGFQLLMGSFIVEPRVTDF